MDQKFFDIVLEAFIAMTTWTTPVTQAQVVATMTPFIVRLQAYKIEEKLKYETILQQVPNIIKDLESVK